MPPNREQPDWQGIWGRLRKLGIEFNEDRRNGIVEAFELLYDSPSIGWRPLLERYAVGDCGVHVHMRQRMLPSPYLLDTPNLCATFEWPRGVFLEDSELRFWADVSDAYDVMESDEEKREMKMAMLVDVPEFIKNRERLFGRILPVVKRLQRLEVCAETWSDSPEAIRFLGGGPRNEIPEVVHGVGVDVDREADFPPITPFGDRVRWRHVPRLNSELPNQMVERGTEVVNHVSDDCAPFVHGQLSGDVTVNDYLSGLVVRIVGDSVQATIDNERIDSLLEEFQVHIRPLDLGPTSV